MPPSPAVWFIVVLLIVFWQLRYTKQKTKISQALDTCTILVSRIEFIVGLAVYMRFVNRKKNIKDRQPYPLKRVKEVSISFFYP